MKRDSTSKIPGWTAFVLFFGLALLIGPGSLFGAEKGAEFNLKEDKVEKENLLDLIFGSAPPMATERGILLLDAFYDRNGNGQKDTGESDLSREISCRVDGVDYSLPAFIPGLENTASYPIACTGENYRPVLEARTVFFKRRGQIIRMELPCRKASDPER